MGLRLYLTRLPQARLEALLDYPPDAPEEERSKFYDDLQHDVYAVGKVEHARRKDGTGWGDATFGLSEMGKMLETLCSLLEPAAYREAPTTPAGASVRGWHELPEWYRELGDCAFARYNTAEDARAISAALDALRIEEVYERERGGLRHALGTGFTHKGIVVYSYGKLRSFYGEALTYGHAVLIELG